MHMNTGLSHQENCICYGYKMPHYFWFVLSGIICDSVQFGIDHYVYLIYPSTFSHRSTACWVSEAKRNANFLYSL